MGGDLKVLNSKTTKSGFPDIERFENESPSHDLADLRELQIPVENRVAEQDRISEKQISGNILSFVNAQEKKAARSPSLTAYLPDESMVPRSTQELLADYAQGYYLKNETQGDLQSIRQKLLEQRVPVEILNSWERNIRLIDTVVKEMSKTETPGNKGSAVINHVVVPLLRSVEFAFKMEQGW